MTDGRHVTTVDDAAAFLSWLGNRRPILAVDTETGGLVTHRDALRLVQFGDGEAAWSLSYRDWRGVIADALDSYAGPVAFHNAPFDLGFLAHNGLPVPALHCVHDTAVMDRLVCPGERHALKVIGSRLYGAAASAEQDALKAAMSLYKWTWATIPDDFPIYTDYARQDTILTARIAEHHLPLVPVAPYEREMVVQDVMYRAERRGLRIDSRYTERLRDNWEHEMSVLRSKVPEFDICNPTKLQRALTLDGWEPTEYTPTGRPKFDAAVRAACDHTFARMHTRYKRLEKWSAAYLNAFLDEQDDNGRLHARINTAQAITGRMSITNPALQTLPRGAEIRNCILPYEGERLWNVDYRAMEMRMFSHLSQDPALVAAARDDLDFHTFTASMVYGIDMGSVTKAQRQIAKSSVSFGKIFGAGPEQVAKQAGVTVAEVDRFNAVYDAQFPGVARFMADVLSTARQREREEGHPYIKTWGGRRVPQTDGRTYALVNYAVQGGSADIFKERIVALDAAGYGDLIVLPVHDSLLFSIPPEAECEVPNIVALMEEHTALSVPFTVDVSGPMDRWGDESK